MAIIGLEMATLAGLALVVSGYSRHHDDVCEQFLTWIFKKGVLSDKIGINEPPPDA
jgi:hypothetical protein